MENSDGEDQEYHIKDISFSIICHNDLMFSFDNSYLKSVVPDSDATMLIRVWIANGSKVSRLDYCFGDISLHPGCLKTLIRSLLHKVITQAVKAYFQANKSDSRFYVKSDDPVEKFISPIISFNQDFVSADLLKEYSKLSAQLYRLDCVEMVIVNFSKHQIITIMADSEGREILDSKTFYATSVKLRCFNLQRFHLVVSHNQYYINENEARLDLGYFGKAIKDKVAHIATVAVAEAADYPMMLSANATNVLFHEALSGHLFSADLIVNGQANLFKGKQGKKLTESSLKYSVLNDLVIYVDPTEITKLGGYNFDAEGIRAQKTILIDHGVVKNFLLSRNSAFRLEQFSNGHCRAEEFLAVSTYTRTVLPEARISHLVIKSDTGLSNDALRKKIVDYCLEHGYQAYLEVDAYAGEVDPDTTNFTLSMDLCHKVYLDGREEWFYGGSLSGTPDHLLSSVLAFGSENLLSSGNCGSSSGWVPVSCDAPPLFMIGHYVPETLPQPDFLFNLARDKYIPEDLP